MDSKETKRFRELWDYAISNYSVAGNGMQWFGRWVNELKENNKEDYELMKPAYEVIFGLTKRTWFICGLDGWVEELVRKEVFKS